MNRASLGDVDGMNMSDQYKHANSFKQLIDNAKVKITRQSADHQVNRDLNLYANHTEIESIQVWLPVYHKIETDDLRYPAQVFQTVCLTVCQNDETTHADLIEGQRYKLLGQLAHQFNQDVATYGVAVVQKDPKKFHTADFKRFFSMIT